MTNVKPIQGFDDLYYICDNGDVWSIKRHKYIKQEVTNGGYKRVNLYKEHKIYHKLVHRLVAEAFISNINNLPIVNHKDENKLNNNVNNLEWITTNDNNVYGTINKRRSESLLNNEYRSKPVIQYDMQFNKISEYLSISDAERQTGYHNSNISFACKHKHRTVGGYYWRYKYE